MKKRVVSLLLALCLVIGLFPLSASAEEPTSGDFGASNGLHWAVTTDETTQEQTLTITGTGAIPDFNTEPDFAQAPWSNYYDIRHIVVEDGVTAIGASAFSGMGVSSVTLPDSVTAIGDWAFQNCGPSFIGEDNTFTMTLPNTLTTIGEGAFFYCPISGTVDLSNVTSLGTMAFNSSAITGVTLPENLTAIPGLAFSNTQLTSVTIPAGVTTIEAGAFFGCLNLASFTVADENASYKSEGGVLFSKDGTQLLCYPLAKTDTSFELPATVTAISETDPITSQVLDCGLKSAQNLATITVAGGNAKYTAIDGVLYENGGAKIAVFPQAWDGTTFTVPAGLTDASPAFGKASITTYRVEDGNTVYATENGVLYKKYGNDLKLCAIPEKWSGGTGLMLAENTVGLEQSAFAYGGSNIEYISFPAGFDFAPGWNIDTQGQSILPTSAYFFAVAEDHAAAKSEDGIIYSKDGKTLIAVPSQMIEDRIIIPEGITKVQSGAIKSQYPLISVSIPADLQMTGDGAFDWTTLGDYGQPVSLMGGDKVRQYVERLSEEGRRYVEYVPLPDMQNLNWYQAKNELERFLNDTAGLPEGQTKRTFPYGTVNWEIFEAYSSWYQSQQSSGGDPGMGSDPSIELPESMTGTTHMMVEDENGSTVELELSGFFMLADPNGMLPVGDNEAPLMFVINEVSKPQDPSENPGGDPSEPGMEEPNPIVDKYREIYMGMEIPFTPAHDNDESGLVSITITAPEVIPHIIVVDDRVTYTGSAIEPQLEVVGEPTNEEFSPFPLTEGVDYTATYTNNINAGEATVTIAAKEGGNCTFAENADLTANFTIIPKDINIIAKPQTIDFGGTISSTPEDVTVEDLADGEELTEITLTGPNTVPGGNITLSGAVIKKGETVTTNNYTINYVQGSLTINKVAAAVGSAPTAKNDLTYTGAAQALVNNDGTATGGAMQYSLDGTTYSADIPTATDAGTYTVYYKVVGDNNHTDSAAASVEATIGKKTVVVTPASGQSKDFNAADPELTYTTDIDGDSTLKTAFDTAKTGALSRAAGENAGTYAIELGTLAAGNNFIVTLASTPVNFTINQIAGTATAEVYVKRDNTTPQTVSLASAVDALKVGSDAPVFATTVTVTDGGDKLSGSTAAITAAGELSYTLANSAAAGTVTLTATVNGGLTNYSSVTVTVTINLTDQTPVTVDLSKVDLDRPYNGEAIADPTDPSEGPTGTYDNSGAPADYNGGWTYAWFAEDGTTSTTPLNAGKYVLKVSVSDTADYVGSATKVVTISKKAVTITASDQTITFGDTFNTADTSKVSATLATGDTISAITLTPSTDNAGTGTITPSGATIQNGSNMNMTANYEITYAAGTLTVEKADPTVTVPTAKTLTYNGTAQALVNAGTATGGTVQYSLEENGTFTTDIPTGTDAGSYTVYYKVVGDNNHNDVAATAVPVTIGKLAVTITPNAQTKTYGAEDPELTYTASTVSPAPEITGALDRKDGDYVGTYTITLGTLRAGDNYELELDPASVDLTIIAAENPAQIAGTATVMKERTVDLAGNVTDVPEGTDTVTYAVTSGGGTMNGSEYTAPATTGTATVTVTVPAFDVDGDGSVEYNAKTGAITITISDKPDAGVSLGTVPESKTYGDSTFTITAAAQAPGTNGVWTWTSSNDSVLAVTGTGAAATVTVVGAGSAAITANYESNDTIGSMATAPITVNKAAVTITADNKKVTIGGTVPAVDTLTYKVTGLKNNDTLTTPPTLAYYDSEGNPVAAADIDTSAAASYKIKASGAVLANAGNYEVTYTDGALTIAAKPVTPPSSGGDTSEPEPTPADEPIVETNTAADGTVTTTTTWPDGQQAVDVTVPDGGKEITVTAPDGEKMAEISIPADPGEGRKFEDVKDGAWYKDSVDSATAYSLFNGTSETKFSPNDPMTRGMLVTVLHNLSGNPEYGTGTDVFEDVKSGVWYEDPVDWAYKAGVASGISATQFSPNKPITREQLVAMLYRYAEKIGAGSKNRTGLASFPDGGRVANYAKDAMQWAVAEGLLSGRAHSGKNYIAPQDSASRAEVATILTKFVEYLKK